MTESLLSDDLLREVIAVGQVDILVGVPTLNNAQTVGEVVKAVHQSFETQFRRERTVLINCDSGSTDGTMDIVRNAACGDSETLIASHALRTMHRISFPYHGLLGKVRMLGTLFAAADLMQARAVALFDADLTSMSPDWVFRLVSPVIRGEADFVAPIYLRHPLEGPLVTQLVRPLMRATYGSRVRDPLASEFACSGAFASHCLAQDVWDKPLMDYGIDLWLTGTALSASFRFAEAPLGARVNPPRPLRLGLPEVFRQVVGALFGCLESHESYWVPRTGSLSVPAFGASPNSPPRPAPTDHAAMIESFRTGVTELSPILGQILSPATLERVSSLGQTPLPEFRFPDPLWVSTVYEAVGAYHRGVMNREHLTQALVPLYLGRAGSFLVEHGSDEEPAIEEALERLSLQFEQSKPELVGLWSSHK